MIKITCAAIAFSLFIFHAAPSSAQALTLKEALNKGLANYGTILAKQNYASASKASVEQSRRDYLPNLVLSAQQDYGTVNGQNGPLYGYGGYGVASSGLPLPTQNWNAGFGALYLANVNWDFFTFGRIRERIKVAKTAAERDQNDLLQEQFQHQVRVASAYLNLLAAQRIMLSQQKNLDRSIVLKNNTAVRAKNGLVPGVDSSLAAAEVSNARISLTKARDVAQEQANRLGLLIGETATDFVLDTAFITRIPANILGASGTSSQTPNPVLTFYKSRVDVANEQMRYYQRQYFPTLSLFGVVQERGSGFKSTYTVDQHNYTSDYATGVNPVRGNYLIGLGATWNLTSIPRNSAQVRSQRFLTKGLQNEYDLVDQQVKAQQALSETKINNALDNYSEAPMQVKAATEAYTQKTTMYKNGLTTLVDVTTTLYTLNRAETDRDIAFTNVWQAFLLKAAAVGDITLFTNEL